MYSFISSVTLKIERLGEIEPFEITVIREKIKQSSVQKDLVTNTNYAKIRINQYTENTPAELIAALDEVCIILSNKE